MRGPLSLSITKRWNGRDAPQGAAVQLILRPDGVRWEEGMRVSIAAPFHRDPAPVGPPGRLDGLWEYEVVELFVANAEGEYLELEFGPHGHYLALRFEGERNCVDRWSQLSPTIRKQASAWSVDCAIPAGLIPRGCDRLNAYAIFGTGTDRTYLGFGSSMGGQPDFHRLDTFRRFSELTACRIIDPPLG